MAKHEGLFRYRVDLEYEYQYQYQGKILLELKFTLLSLMFLKAKNSPGKLWILFK
jgi:hypothetical protein